MKPIENEGERVKSKYGLPGYVFYLLSRIVLVGFMAFATDVLRIIVYVWVLSLLWRNNWIDLSWVKEALK